MPMLTGPGKATTAPLPSSGPTLLRRSPETIAGQPDVEIMNPANQLVKSPKGFPRANFRLHRTLACNIEIPGLRQNKRATTESITKPMNAESKRSR